MAENTVDITKLVQKLSKRGPHHVLCGDLQYAGLPGKVYTPAEGTALPAVAFGHDWMTGVHRYHLTFKHLASWGIVVAAPDTEKGFNPDHDGFAMDLHTAIDVLAGVRLGHGKITVSPGKLGIIGHGMGGGCAVLAASRRSDLRAVAALYPAATNPDSYVAARSVRTKGLVIGSSEDQIISAGDPAKLAQNWTGDVVYREIKGGTQNGFAEGIVTRALMGMGLPQHAQQERARALLTGFLLATLDEQHKYDAFTNDHSEAKKVETFTKGSLIALGDNLALRHRGSGPLLGSVDNPLTNSPLAANKLPFGR
ncbi:MAG: dienelactone hydrolase family protein [Corynebacterium sp.]|nr:dienelactone hydrolase family protein [Corynebacterium sp.]